jgi:hypothetical protein
MAMLKKRAFDESFPTNLVFVPYGEGVKRQRTNDYTCPNQYSPTTPRTPISYPPTVQALPSIHELLSSMSNPAPIYSETNYPMQYYSTLSSSVYNKSHLVEREHSIQITQSETVALNTGYMPTKSSSPYLAQTLEERVSPVARTPSPKYHIAQASFHNQVDSITKHKEPTKQKTYHYLPEECVDIMQRWFESNKHHPYPTTAEKEHLSDITGLTVTQVANWFSNQRKRLSEKQKEIARKALRQSYVLGK